jgi:hypothetical protein
MKKMKKGRVGAVGNRRPDPACIWSEKCDMK